METAKGQRYVMGMTMKKDKKPKKAMKKAMKKAVRFVRQMLHEDNVLEKNAALIKILRGDQYKVR